VWWVVDEFVQEGRPLGFSPSAYGPNNYSAPQPSWGGWPYNTGGRDLAPPPAPSTPKAESDSALAEGRGLWKSGDYTGALACFKRAVASNLSNGSARLHMGLALLATGDLANADKAVASALVHLGGPDDVTAVNLEGSFRNPKERSKFESKLVPARDGSGTLSVALAQHLVGLKAKAAKLLADSKDPSAPTLAAVLR
jgi:tetratricopeptide (TPR) repeat protein